MKKNVWIFNHYATETFNNKGGRHFFFAKYLVENGFRVTIFCASTIHGSDEEIEIPNDFFDIKNIDGIDYVFIKTPKYSGNGKKRLFNMLSFYRKLLAFSRISERYCEKPDIILASSVHPLTLVAGIKISRKFGVKCICEVRDLWPMTLVEIGALKNNSLISKLLYLGEKEIYKKADALIFTMEGGKDYILEKKWESKIVLSKIFHINNGIDLSEFERQSELNKFYDEDLENKSKFKVIYTGSIIETNAVDFIINSAKELMEYNMLFLIYGDGNKRKELEKKCKCENITNVIFKGKKEKKYIPFILKNADLNIMTGIYTKNLYKYGLSLNKMFEYIASGKPILSNIECNYDLLKKYGCGLTVSGESYKRLKDGILLFYNMKREEIAEFSKNSAIASQDYDFKKLTQKLISVITIYTK